ncbi:unnamed protein product [Caenorhabditis angaria]|uniref:UVR domain-containing protein n=1 Tax=Caenorhabditis angaria TaxID=860376 RepID=A0A9P1MXD4_9PELO|nr:unnamed protein product [Caenorhabditis angaria]
MQLEYKVESLSGKSNPERSLLIEKEWISEKNPKYPLELKLALSKFSEIEKIEIVAHNIYVPRKIAIFSSQFIGEVIFKKPTSSFELKNIFLDEKCDFLVFHIYEPYEDEDLGNPDVQVGLIDVKLFGKYLPTGENPVEGVINDKIPDRKYSKELEAMIEAIEKNKQIAVANEDFQLAKSAQLSIRQLKKSTKEMEELENDKSDAVQDGDYQRAIDLQDEITMLRSTIIASIEPRLLDNTMKTTDEIHRPKKSICRYLSPTEVPSDPSHTYLMAPRDTLTGSTRKSSSSRSKRSRPITSETRRSSSSSNSSRAVITPSTSSSRRSTSSRRSSAALRRTSTQDPAAPDPEQFRSSSDVQDLSEHQVLEMIPPDGRANVRTSISIFGLPTIAKIYSKHFENRKESINEIRERVDQMSQDYLHSNFESINYLIAHLLKDPLYVVYRDVLLLWHHFCTSIIPDLHLEKLMPRVAAESIDIFALRVIASDKRLVNDTMKTFRDASKLKFVAKSYVSKLLAAANSKNLKGRAILVDVLVILHGVPNDEISLTSIATSSFATKCIQISDPQVRSIGKDLMLKLYKNGEESAVRQQLHKFAVSDPNNPTYQKIVRQIGLPKKSHSEGQKKISFML